MLRLCEIPRWDSTSVSRCKYVGFAHCTKYKKKLTETEDGWRMCWSGCEKPFTTYK